MALSSSSGMEWRSSWAVAKHMFIAMPIIANISPCRLHVNIFQENVVFLHEMHSANQMANAAKDPDELHKQEFSLEFYLFI